VKLVIAVFESGLLPDIMAVLKELDIRQWTRWSDVRGAGQRHVHEGNPVWPGLNEMMLIVLPADKAQPLVDRCHQVRDAFPLTPGMKFIITDCEIV
jgi:hypothetical protein